MVHNMAEMKDNEPGICCKSNATHNTWYDAEHENVLREPQYIYTYIYYASQLLSELKNKSNTTLI